MSPTTTEAKLEEELNLIKEDLEDVEFKIEYLQSQIRKLRSKKVGFRVALDEKKEELRRFRHMYPNICKPPTEQ